MTQVVRREVIVAMLSAAAAGCGLGLRAFHELGTDDRLEEPRLRDLWLIWGDTIVDADLVEPVTA